MIGFDILKFWQQDIFKIKIKYNQKFIRKYNQLLYEQMKKIKHSNRK